MASDGPKVSIKVDDSVNAKIEERVALLKQARKEVRELEREAEKAIRTTGKASDEMLKKIDDAKRRAGGLNNEVRGLRSSSRPSSGFSGGSGSRTSLGQLKDKLEAFEFRKNFGRGLKGELFGGSNGGLGGGTMARAGGIALLAYAGLRGGLATYDRDVQGERMGADIGTQKAFGQDTAISEMELARRNIGNNGASKFFKTAGGSIPFFGGKFRAGIEGIEEALAVYKGNSKYDIASAKLGEITKDMDASQRQRFLESAKQDADGNAIVTAVMDKVETLLPNFINKFFGSRKEGQAAEAAQKLARAKAFEEAGYKLVDANSFGDADAEFQKAAKESGSNRATTAAEAWNERENAMQSKIRAHNMWNPVPRIRVGM